MKFVNQLLPLFNIQLLEINGIQKYIKSSYIKPIKDLIDMVNKNLN
ncbi:hypothetical protein KKG31_05820 [Patescibacteria group bacterium]|nr:hypothetical protein [Patescibacteria group bacterium]MBU1758623.1 hypothetical protein [Patescibacteria group bacterium]